MILSWMSVFVRQTADIFTNFIIRNENELHGGLADTEFDHLT